MNYKRKDNSADLVFGDPEKISEKKRLAKIKAQERHKNKPKKESKVDTRYNLVLNHGKV